MRQIILMLLEEIWSGNKLILVQYCWTKRFFSDLNWNILIECTTSTITATVYERDNRFKSFLTTNYNWIDNGQSQRFWHLKYILINFGSDDFFLYFVVEGTT